MTTFYTLTIDPPVTLCEFHALRATNTGLGQEFETVADAIAAFSLVMAAIGDPTDILDSTGPCGQCELEGNQ